MQTNAFIERLAAERATAIVRSGSAATAAAAIEAAIRGGFSIVEFTLTTPDALELVRDFAQREELVVGAGTVMTESDARDAVDAGASFLVSPVTDERVIAIASEAGVAAMPGTHTPTEMMRAHAAGAPLLKLFPAPAGGPAYLRSVLAPLPSLKVVPTNGVFVDNCADWLHAGAFAVGFAAPLFVAEDMAAGAWDRIEERAGAMLRAVRGASPSSSVAAVSA